MNANAHEFKNGAKKKPKPTTEAGVTEPQPKTKTHRRHGDTEKIKTNFDHRGHRGARRRTGNQKLASEGAEKDQSNKIWAK